MDWAVASASCAFIPGAVSESSVYLGVILEFAVLARLDSEATVPAGTLQTVLDTLDDEEWFDWIQHWRKKPASRIEIDSSSPSSLDA
jgi:hypothetical protein